jgi:benzoyl-CoA reductase/2-hydroxyglutaryl-CoA dehydratase subunit BcrC/BadD/HgdB
MDLTKYNIKELIEFATKYLENKKKMKIALDKYRKTIKGKMATRKSSLKYYNKHKKTNKTKKPLES